MGNLIISTLVFYELLGVWIVVNCHERKEFSVSYNLLDDLLFRTSPDYHILTSYPSPNGSLKKALFYNGNTSEQNWDISDNVTMAVDRQWNDISLNYNNNNSTAILPTIIIEIRFLKTSNSSDRSLPLFSVSHEIELHSSIVMKKWFELSVAGDFLSIHGGHSTSHLLTNTDKTREDNYDIKIPHLVVNGTWYHVVISIVNHKSLRVFLNCSLIYKNSTFPWISLTLAQETINKDISEMKTKLKMRLGQCINGSHVFEGIMGEANLFLLPGNSSTTLSPSRCSQYEIDSPISLESKPIFSNASYSLLRTQLLHLMEQINALEERVARLETCKCQHFCSHEGKQYDVGNTWNTSMTCETCSCIASHVISCKPIVCQKTDCKFPVLQPERCCPTCLRDCQFQNHRFDNGEVLQKGCIQCECQDGSMNCKKKTCPPLNCPVYHQVWATPTRCCKQCKVPDHCQQGRRCPSNSKCINLATSHLCMCQPGFKGDRPWNVSKCTPKYSNSSEELFNETGPESASLLGDPLFLAQRGDGQELSGHEKIPCSDKALRSRACKMCACTETQKSQAKSLNKYLMVDYFALLLMMVHLLWTGFIFHV